VPRKPDPASAREAVQALGLPPQEVLLVGDSTIDIETARRAGLAVAAVTWGYHDRAALAAAGPDLWLERVEQLGQLAGKVEPERG
jgi:phosphoglycolate phosphatase